MKKIILSLLVLSNLHVLAQKEALPLTRSVRFEKVDSIYEFNLLLNSTNVEAEDNIRYFWFAADSVYSNLGGFSGMLLHSQYEVFSSNHALLIKGSFKNGRRDGVWKYWYVNGEIKRIEKYKKGLLHGNMLVYSLEGSLLKETKYKKGLKDGEEKEYQRGELIETTYYKNNEEVEKKSLFSFLKGKNNKSDEKEE